MMAFLDDLVENARKRKKQLERGVKSTVAQVNPLDNGRTYRTEMDNKPAPKAPKSAFQQLTHNGVTNVAGDMAKPVARFPLNYANAFGNLGRKAAGLSGQTPQQQFQDPLTKGLVKATGATGSMRQLGGDAANIGLTAFAPGTSKVVAGGVTKVLPRVIPKPAAKIIAQSAGGATAGGIVGGPSNVATLVAEDKQPLTPQNVKQAFTTGAKAGAITGGALPVAGAIAGQASKAVAAGATKVRDVNRQRQLEAASMPKSVKNVPASKLISLEGAPDRARVEYYKKQISGGQKPAAIIAMKDKAGKLGIEDGKHRFQAYKELGIANIPTKIISTGDMKRATQGGYVKLPSNNDDLIETNLSKNPDSLDLLDGKTVPQLEAQGAKTKLVASSLSDNPSTTTSPQALPEYSTKRVNNFDKAVRSTRSIIERQGESGKQLGGMLQGARDTQELYLGELQKRIPTVRSLKGKDYENFVDATQGLATPKNPKIAKAVQEWQATHPAIRERAVAAGLDVGDLGQTYYPHFVDYDQLFKDKNTFNEAINHLVKSGQATSPEEAMKLLNYAKDVSRNRTFGNLEASRLVDLPFYDKTPNSLISYLGGSAKRIAQTETFGAKDENALKLITKAGQEGFDTEAMKNAYDVAVGAKRYNPTSEKVTGNIRKYVTTTRLGLGALTNISQNVNTGVVTGHMRTMASMLKQLDPKTRAFVGDTGVIADAVLNDIRTQAGYKSFSSKAAGKVIDKITAPLFGTVEKFNRSVSATAGRDYALRLAQKGDESTLRKLGVTGEIKGKTLTDAQQIQAARKIVEKTQFKVDPQDLPGWADTPGGKLVAQFRTFSYKQQQFMFNEVLKPAAKGNLLPLSRLLAALPLGYALYETKRVIAGRPEEENPTKRGLATFQNIGGAGIVLDMYNNLNPIGSKYIPSDRRTSMAIGAFGGPAVGVAAQGIGAVSEAVQRKNTPEDESRLEGKVVAGKTDEDYTDLTPLSRFGLQQIPIVGTAVKNRLLPFKQESDADAGKTGNKDTDAAIAAATEAEKASSKAIASGLSKDENALRKLSTRERQALIDGGTISQERFDQIDSKGDKIRKSTGADIGSKNVKIKNDDRGSTLINEIGDMSKDDRTKWELSDLDPQYNDLYERASQIRVTGMPDLPKNNATLKAYADYLKTKEKSTSEFKLNSAKKTFLRNAYQSTVSENARELFGNYSNAEKIEALTSGGVPPQDFEAALALDDMLINAGLSATPKIGNAVRREFGYNDAPARSKSSGGKKSKLTPSDFKLPTELLSKYSRQGASLAANASLRG